MFKLSVRKSDETIQNQFILNPSSYIIHNATAVMANALALTKSGVTGNTKWFVGFGKLRIY